MESCPKADIKNLKDLLVAENLYLHTEVNVDLNTLVMYLGVVFLFVRSYTTLPPLPKKPQKKGKKRQ